MSKLYNITVTICFILLGISMIGLLFLMFGFHSLLNPVIWNTIVAAGLGIVAGIIGMISNEKSIINAYTGIES